MEKLEKKVLPEQYPARGPLLERMSRLAYYQHTRALFEQVKSERSKLTVELGEGTPTFKNPREEMDFLHRKKTLQVLTQQEKRLQDKLLELQEQIRKDMATFDEVVTNTQ
jgi:hypothetical protein